MGDNNRQTFTLSDTTDDEAGLPEDEVATVDVPTVPEEADEDGGEDAPTEGGSNEQAEAAAKIQAGLRGMEERKKFQKEKDAATKIEAIARGNHVRHDLHEKKDAASKIQAGMRGMEERRKFKKEKEAAVKIEAVARGNHARHEVEAKRKAMAKEKQKAGNANGGDANWLDHMSDKDLPPEQSMKPSFDTASVPLGQGKSPSMRDMLHLKIEIVKWWARNPRRARRKRRRRITRAWPSWLMESITSCPSKTGKGMHLADMHQKMTAMDTSNMLVLAVVRERDSVAAPSKCLEIKEP